jgi:secondary thiamine-phosphate synthase enzyme
MQLVVPTSEKRQIIDITGQIERLLTKQEGLVNVFIKHTTAAITTADLDPGTDQYFIDFLNSLVPNLQWRHPHNPKHAPDHLLSSLIGSEVTMPVKAGKLQTGTWQRVVLVELDGPRDREIEITHLKKN